MGSSLAFRALFALSENPNKRSNAAYLTERKII
jgi:hypothetical protein